MRELPNIGVDIQTKISERTPTAKNDIQPASREPTFSTENSATIMAFTRTDTRDSARFAIQHPRIAVTASFNEVQEHPKEEDIAHIQTAISDIAQVLQNTASSSTIVPDSSSTRFGVSVPPLSPTRSDIDDNVSKSRSIIHLNDIATRVTDHIAHADLTSAHNSLYRAIKGVKGTHALDSSLAAVFSKLIIFLSDKSVDSALRSLVLITMRKNSGAPTDLEDDDAEDPLERYVPAAHKCITWKLFERILEDKIRMERSAYLAFSVRLIENDEPERALKVLDALGREQWDKEVYKLAIKSHILRRPSDVESAQKLFREFGQPTVTITAANGATRVIEQPLAGQATDEDRELLWLFLNSQVKEARWVDCVLRYEGTRNKTQGPKLADLDNAMMEVCLTYGQFEHGWQIYERMANIDKHTPRAVVAICRKAFSGSTDAESRFMWEARAWALYMRFKTSDSLRSSGGTLYLLHELLEIAADSPEAASRYDKVNRIFSELKTITGPLGGATDEWVIQPVLRLCLRLFKTQLHEGHAAEAKKYFDRSFEIYNECRRTGLRLHAETYIILLQMVTLHNDVGRFGQLCKDLTASGLPLTGDAFTAMKEIHDELQSPSPRPKDEELEVKGQLLRRLSVAVKQAEASVSHNEMQEAGTLGLGVSHPRSSRSSSAVSVNDLARRTSSPAIGITIKNFLTTPTPSLTPSLSNPGLDMSSSNAALARTTSFALETAHVTPAILTTTPTEPTDTKDQAQMGKRVAEFRRKLSDMNEEDARKLVTQCISASLNELNELAAFDSQGDLANGHNVLATTNGKLGTNENKLFISKSGSVISLESNSKT